MCDFVSQVVQITVLWINVTTFHYAYFLCMHTIYPAWEQGMK